MATAGDRRIDWKSPEAQKRLRKRYGADMRLQGLGIGAIVLAIVLLGTLIVSITATGFQAFVQTHVTFSVNLSKDRVDPAAIDDAPWRAIIREDFLKLYPEVEGRKAQRAVTDILTDSGQYILRDYVKKHPELIGQRVRVTIPASDIFDQLQKGVVRRDVPMDQRPKNMTDEEIGYFDKLVKQGRISTPFNWALVTSADSTKPELAGLKAALAGSAYALLVCFLISFPVGIAAAIYLEEFAPKNRITDIIEVNINNLAAVPSIVFGLLGLALFINFFGLPRSSSLVGGLVLALLVLPTIIIATRNSLKAVPPSIREAGLGVGASKHQAVFDHVLPLALPGIMTGTIIGLAHALGETAPLLLIGMKSFVTTAPESLTAPATALPTQIYNWSDSPERGFTARTSAAIIVLLGFLIVMNGIAVFLRQKLERKW
jgi:phosphate transport system permease protein